MNDVAVNIKMYRKKRGYSQEELAKKINVTRQTVSNWETGKAYPDIETLKNLSEELDTKIDNLIYNQNDRRPKYKSVSSKPIFGVLIGFWLLLTLGGVWIGIPLFGLLFGRSIEREPLCLLCFGILMLALLIAVCTYIIIDEIRNQGMMNQLEEDSEKEEF